MTVLSELSKIAYIGDSSQTLYPIPFEYINVDNIHVSVYTKENEFVEDWTYSNQYIIENSNVKVLSGFEIDNTKKLLIIRVIDAVQDNRYREGGDFPAKSTETSFDKLTMLIQQHQEVLDRCVKVEVLDNQTPEELLAEVYSKLDSATDVANDAIAAAEQATIAAENATTAVEVAQKQIEQTQQYVTEAKVEINNTKESATSTISTTTENAKSDITKTVTDAKSDINTAIDEATTNISNIVSNAEGEVANIAITEANKAISSAAQEATDLVNAYINSEIKPQLDEATASASGSATSASSSATAAQNSANQASSSATSASSSATSAANSATAAAKSAASIDTSNLVDLSSNQTIAGQKVFTNQVEFLNEGAIYASSSAAGARDNRFRCKFYQYGLSDAVYPTNTVFSGIRHYDKNNFEYGTIFSSMSPTGVVNTNLWVHTPKGTAATMGIQQDADGNTSTYAPTPATNSNSNQIATTSWVNTRLGGEGITSTEIAYLDGVSSNVQTQLNGKANTSASNFNATGKSTILGWCIPNYSAGVSITNTTTYTAPKRGIFIDCNNNSSTDMNIYVNGNQVCYESKKYIDVQILVDAGDVITANSNFKAKFFPLKGA